MVRSFRACMCLQLFRQKRLFRCEMRLPSSSSTETSTGRLHQEHGSSSMKTAPVYFFLLTPSCMDVYYQM